MESEETFSYAPTCAISGLVYVTHGMVKLSNCRDVRDM
jgi:hypothetical protein